MKTKRSSVPKSPILSVKPDIPRARIADGVKSATIDGTAMETAEVNYDNRMEVSGDAVDLDGPSCTNLSRSQRKRMKKKEKLSLRAAFKAKRPKKTESDPPLSSNIVLPRKVKGFVPSLETEESLLAAARSRLAQSFEHVLKIQPIPRPCPPGLLKDLCPLAYSIRIPTKSGARYAFLKFCNQSELEMAHEALSKCIFNDKPLKISLAKPNSTTSTWHRPEEREAVEFDWKRIFVTNLARSTTRLDLAQVFRKASAIRMGTYDDRSCKGTCILTYKSCSDAQQAFETRQGTFVRGVPIYVNFALKQKSYPKPQHEISEPLESVAINNKKNASQISKPSAGPVHPIPAEPMDFMVDRGPSRSHSIRKDSKIATARPRQPYPKLLQKHQLKNILGAPKDSPATALDLLLKPSMSKPKHAKKSKQLTKRGKQSKHR